MQALHDWGDTEVRNVFLYMIVELELCHIQSNLESKGRRRREGDERSARRGKDLPVGTAGWYSVPSGHTASKASNLCPNPAG